MTRHSDTPFGEDPADAPKWGGPILPPIGVPFRLTTPIKPRDMTREQHDQGHRIMQAALAEAGDPTPAFWDDRLGAYRMARRVDPDRLARAQAIAMSALGMPFEVEMTATDRSDTSASTPDSGSSQVGPQ